MELMHTAHVPAGPGPFPTLIALHGWGASAHDLLGLAPLLFGGEALVLCPQGPVELQVGPHHTGYGWFPLVPGQPPEPAAFRAAANALRDFLAGAARAYPIDPARTVVLGFSQGGLMAFEWALAEPEVFAGLAALSTWFPAELAEHLPVTPEQARLQALMLHGTADQLISIERARESRERLRPYGVQLQYREFPMGHEIRGDALGVLGDWLERVFVSNP